MSALIDRAISGAGLAGILDARRAAPLSEEDVARLRAADLLALGALADRVRADEAGAEVRIYAADGADGAGDASLVVLPQSDRELTGLELLREVATARIAGHRGTRVRVDWTACGLELAQIALGFGASELCGRVANKRGLPFAEGELAGVGKRSRLEPALTVKQREIASLVRRAGRTPIFVRGDGAPAAPAAPAEHPEEAR